jgi:uncharacterized protein YjbI with pentapeptide repeats
MTTITPVGSQRQLVRTMSIDDFVARLHEGIRDFSSIVFRHPESLNVYASEINGYTKGREEEFREHPLLFISSDLRNLAAQNLSIPYTRFDGAIVDRSEFSGADLRNTRWNGVNFDVYTDFRDADLRGADFRGSKGWKYVDKSGANLNNALFDDVSD